MVVTLFNFPILAQNVAKTVDDLFSIYRAGTASHLIDKLTNQHGQYLSFTVVYSPGEWLYSF
jgi:hypothetical protein